MSLSIEDRDEISRTIKLVVNGNINRMEGKLDAHIENHGEMVSSLKPVIEAVQWINTTRKFALWIAGFAIAVTGTLTIFK